MPGTPGRRPRVAKHFSVTAVFLVVAFAGAWFALLHLWEGQPRDTLFSDHYDDFRLLANALARTSVTLISTVFACLFLAIPLTANMFTPQLIENFWRARSNRIVLGLYVFSAGNAVWLSGVPAQERIPRVHLSVSMALVLLTIVLLLPYLFSIFRQIDPAQIVARVSENVKRAMRSPSPGPDGRYRDVLARRIQDLGNLALRMLERADRDGAILAVAALEDCAEQWIGIKAKHKPAFFVVDSSHFPGLSKPALHLINETRTWVEWEILQQFLRCFDAALARAPDVISAIGRSLRHLAATAAAAHDDGALEFCLRASNNFMREAVKRKDIHAVYDLLWQRTELSRAIWPTHPGSVLQGVRELNYYASLAADAGILFTRALVTYDLARLLAEVEGHSEERDRIFETLLAAGEPAGTDRAVRKARLVAAARFEGKGDHGYARRLMERLQDWPRETLRDTAEEILSAERWFWEITDRQENLNWLEEREKAALRKLVGPR